MKKGPEHPDAVRKKLVGEYLRNADRLLKTGEYVEALSEVDKSLELEPGNFYAQAYRERIIALQEKHPRQASPDGPVTEKKTAHPAGPAQHPPPLADAAQPDREDPGGLSGTSGAEIGELPVEEAPEAGLNEIDRLKDQIDRERNTSETEAGRQAEEYARKGLEEELRRREESDRLNAAEQKAVADATEGARSEALREIVNRATESFARLLASGDTEGAFRELARIRIVEPEHAAIPALAAELETATRKSVTPAGAAPRQAPRSVILQWFGGILRSAWSEGKPNTAQNDILAAARKRFGITAAEEQSLLPSIQRDLMTEAMREAYREGDPDPETTSFLESLARDLSVADPQALLASIRK